MLGSIPTTLYNYQFYYKDMHSLTSLLWVKLAWFLTKPMLKALAIDYNLDTCLLGSLYF